MKVRWFGDSVKADVRQGMEPLLRSAGEFVLGEANDRAPIEEGTLIGSGDVDADDGSATISYDTAYAVRLHENPQYHFQHGREGKWLERTLMQEAGRVKDYLAAGLRRLLA